MITARITFILFWNNYWHTNLHECLPRLHSINIYNIWTSFWV